MTAAAHASPAGPARAAWVVLAVHASFVVFGTAALVTILAGEFPTVLQTPYTAEIFRLSWKFTGPTLVVLGALAALLHSMPRLGTARALTLCAVATLIALASELAGTNAGLPFGPYHYTEMLGYRINGDVPFPIPISWYYMLYGSLAICGRLLPVRPGARAAWGWALAAGVILTAWDIAQDPAMTAVSPVHWAWDFARLPGWAPAWLTRGFFYGMPLSNWIGWVLTGTIIARVMLALVPASTWRDAIAPSPLPLWLYALNGVMPIALCARHGLWWAAGLGFVAMAVPLALAVRAGAAPSPRRVTGGAAALALTGD
ncbi:MAG: carotenoid biosynthesis protein [Gemmatimonadetes bacterium]|nr:carotenoid biosynthesis protein [Gemmatimonadota bacterium]